MNGKEAVIYFKWAVYLLTIIIISLGCNQTKLFAQEIDETISEMIQKAKQAYEQDDDEAKALKILENVIGNDPNNYMAYYYRGVINYYGMRYFQAFQNFKKATELKPDGLNSHIFYCLTANEVDIHPELKLSICKKSYELVPGNYITTINLGHVYLTFGQFDQAVKLCQKAYNLKPEFQSAFLLGYAYRLKNDKKTAMQYFMEALKYAEYDKNTYKFFQDYYNFFIKNEWLKWEECENEAVDLMNAVKNEFEIYERKEWRQQIQFLYASED